MRVSEGLRIAGKREKEQKKGTVNAGSCTYSEHFRKESHPAYLSRE